MLGIAVEKVCQIVGRAKAFDVKADVIEPEPGANPTDEEMLEVLEVFHEDPEEAELQELIVGLNEEEQVNLVALAWLGRGTYGADEWEAALAEADRAHNEHTAEYLTGIPLLGSYLEEGLSMLGYSCEE